MKRFLTHNRTLLLACACALGIPFTSFAAPELSATLSTNRITVGDRILLTLSATHAADERIVVPAITREPLVAVWDTQTTTRDLSENRRETTANITFTSFIVGEHRVATNALLLLAPGGREEQIPFPEVTFTVDSVLTNPPPPVADLKPPVKLPTHHAWLKIAATLLAVILVGVAVALLLRRWLRRPVKPVATRKIPPHEIALTALQALRQRGLIERGEAEPFYVELSAIVRTYLEDRFDLRAPEQTTEEFIRASSQSNALSTEHRQVTADFLEQSDLVKFARFQPDATDMNRAWDAAARLVRETIAEATP